MRRNLLPYSANRNQTTLNQKSIISHLNNMRTLMNAPPPPTRPRIQVETNVNIETESDDDYLDDYLYDQNSVSSDTDSDDEGYLSAALMKSNS